MRLIFAFHIFVIFIFFHFIIKKKMCKVLSGIKPLKDVGSVLNILEKAQSTLGSLTNSPIKKPKPHVEVSDR